jgi:CubicO group peptidase (beta-lactamase class C family)
MKTLIILFLLLPSFAFAQQQQIVSLDSFISKQVQDYKIPGLAIGIIKNGKVMFKKGYGITSTTDSVPVTTATVFPIMSCTKAFTAAAIGLLVDQGKVGWGDKVVHYLPDFKLSDTSITNELTIADILSHRSGLESYEGDLLWYGTSYSRQEIVKRIKYSAVRNRFRKDHGYQNVMYLVAGLVIEKVTGQSWDDFIEAKFFSPLSMKKSSTSIKEMVKAKSHAKPHLTSQPLALMNLDNIAPAGAINSTIDDLLNWLLLWIDKGMYKGKKLFSELTYDTITTEKIKVSSSSDESYGFGWNIGYANGKKVLAHGGGLPGFKSYAIIMPENKTGVVILTNKLTYLNEELAGIILNYLNGEETDWKNAEKICMAKTSIFPIKKMR